MSLSTDLYGFKRILSGDLIFVIASVLAFTALHVRYHLILCAASPSESLIEIEVLRTINVRSGGIMVQCGGYFSA